MSLCQNLFTEVEKLTGIPQKLQALSYRQRTLDPQHPMCDYNFSDDNVINLSIKGLGGGPSDDDNFIINSNKLNLIKSSDSDETKDECVSCGERAYFFYQNCKTSRCKECNDLWHKRPK